MAYNEEKGTDIPLAMASPFGRGISVGSTCGAIVGSVMVLGALKGRESAEDRNESRRYTIELMNLIKEKYGTFDCIGLKKNGVSCVEIIEYAYGLLNESV